MVTEGLNIEVGSSKGFETERIGDRRNCRGDSTGCL